MPNERRKTLRQNLGIPVRVQGFLADGGTWEELTTTLDVSYGGACFSLGHDAELGQVLLLSLPLPKRLRQFDLTNATYRVYSLVRGVRRRDERPRVGVMFFGKYPPREFQERPAARFLLPTDSVANAPVPRGLRGDTPLGGTPAVRNARRREEVREEVPSPDTLVGAPANWPSTPTPTGSLPRPTGLRGPDASGRYNTPPPMTAPSTIPKGRVGVPPPPLPGAPRPEFQPSREVPEDRRGAPRVQLFVNFTIQLVDEWGAVLQEELTVADNVSRGGARVMTSLGFQAGEILLLQEAGGGFATRAEVRAITKVQPTVDRLHLRFLDRQAPERLLRS
jgi:PilZ domain